MTKKVHTIQNAPTRLPTWSQAVEAHGLVYLAGQSGQDPSTGQIPSGGIEAETRQVLENIGAILRSIGLDYSNVISATTYLTDMADFESYNTVYGEFFPNEPPARATVEAGLVPPLRIEIQVVAAR
jgi:2-iminobutanoate/2-iminopropanoate deaminase